MDPTGSLSIPLVIYSIWKKLPRRSVPRKCKATPSKRDLEIFKSLIIDLSLLQVVLNLNITLHPKTSEQTFLLLWLFEVLPWLLLVLVVFQDTALLLQRLIIYRDHLLSQEL